MSPEFAMPVVMVTTPHTNCLVSINGVMLGESCLSPALPTAADGCCYVTLFPLEQPYDGVLMPFGIKLYFHQGRMVEDLPHGAIAYCSQRGLVELCVSLPFCPVPPKPSAPYAISRVEHKWQNRPLVTTLYHGDGSMRLGIEDSRTDALLYLHHVEDLSEGRLSIRPFTDQEGDVVLTGSGSRGPRFLLFGQRGGSWQCLIDEYGHGEFIKEGLTVTRDAGDLCGHQLRCRYRMDGERLKKETRVGYFTAAPKALSGARQCIGLCQCLIRGLYEEAHGMLSRELQQSLTPKDLAAFFGAFCAVRPRYSAEDGGRFTLSLAYPTEAERCYALTEYTFTCKDGFVDNIERTES